MTAGRLTVSAAEYMLTQTIWILDVEARRLDEVTLEQYAAGRAGQYDDGCRVYLERSRAVAALEALQGAS